MPSSTASPAPVSARRRGIHPGAIVLPTVAVILSFVMTWATVGFGPEFLPRWLRGFVTTLVVLPFVLIGLGVLEKQVDRFIGGTHWALRKLLVAGITACVIETVIAFAVTAVSRGFGSEFGYYWWLAFSRSLPAGLVIGLFMSFYMKPKMDRMRQAVVLR